MTDLDRLDLAATSSRARSIIALRATAGGRSTVVAGLSGP